MIKAIESLHAPQAVGPYSQAVAVNGFIFCSGQIAIDISSGNLVEGIENQTHQVLKNLDAVLREAGSNLNHVVKTTVLLKNMTDYPKVNEIYAQYFTEVKPARATYAVAGLPKDSLIEIEAIAVFAE